jgi:hypothetical protein
MFLVKKKSAVNTDYIYMKLLLMWFPVNKTQIKIISWLCTIRYQGAAIYCVSSLNTQGQHGMQKTGKNK